MKKKNSKKSYKHLMALLVILVSFSVLIANAQENQTETIVQSEVDAPAALAICDHNNDGVRNLSDVPLFAVCKDTFDANNDGVHNLSDVSAYVLMNQDDNFCRTTFKCTPDPVTPAVPVEEVPHLDICDHNNDGVRNLSDVALFAACKDTFDANNDGVHNLEDVALYASMNQDNTFCRDTFKCTPDRIVPPTSTGDVQPATTGSSFLAICDHNKDGVRNLSDVAEFAVCKDTFDANNDGVHNLEDVALYASMNQDDNFCRTNFKCVATPNTPSTSQVLGEKIKTCKVDQDVIGQTKWADGTLIRGCDMKVYRIENQQKKHIVSLKDLFKYIGQRIYNVTDDIIALF